MRLCFPVMFIAIFICSAVGAAEDNSWQHLLDRADSLLVAGELDVANTVADHVKSEALTRYGISDTTVEVRFYREGVSRGYYFPSYTAADQMYSRVLSVKESALGETDPDLIETLSDLGEIRLMLFQPSDARELYERALSISEASYGPGHPQTGRALLRLADAHSYLYSYDRAESLCTASLSILEESLGSEHPDVLRAVNYLGIAYHAQGRIEEAVPLYERALAGREKVLGPDHPDVGSSLGCLAAVHRDRGEYQEAEQLCIRALEIRKSRQGFRHPDVAYCMHSLAALCRIQGKYAEAEDLFDQSLAIKEELLGPDHPDVANSLNSLAVLYGEQGRDDEVESLYERALAIEEKAYGPDSPALVTNLTNLASLRLGQGEYKEAEALLTRALAITEREHGPEHEEAGFCLRILAGVYAMQQRYDEAERSAKRVLAIWEKTLGVDHPFIAVALTDLASLYIEAGRYSEVEAPIRRALTIMETVFGSESPRVAASLLNLGDTYWIQGRYADADSVYAKALTIQEKALGTYHPTFVAKLNCLGMIYLAQGRYAEAERMLKHVLDAWERSSEPDGRQIAATLNNLGLLYVEQGRCEEGEALCRRALAVEEESLGPDHPSVASTLSNLAFTLRTQGGNAEAESLYRRSLDITACALGQAHADRAATLFNLGQLCREDGRYEEAESLFTRGLRITEASLGSDHPHVAAGLHGLANMHTARGRYAPAESLLERALVIREASLGTEHPLVAATLGAMCRIRRLQYRDVEALEMAERASEIRQRSFEDNAIVLSEKDALRFSRLLRKSVDDYLTCYFDLPYVTSDMRTMAINRVLAVKGAVSDGVLEGCGAIVEEQDSVVIALAESLKQTKLELSRLFVRGADDDVAQYRSSMDSLSGLANELEAELSAQSSSYRRHRETRDISAAKIAGSLADDATLVEFLRFQYGDRKLENKVPHYLAVIIAKHAAPVVLDLGEVPEIDGSIETYRNHMLRLAGSGTAPTLADLDAYRRPARDLYSRIWAPIEDNLQGPRMVLISPDGALSMVAFGSLIDSQGAYVAENYQIHYLSAGRDLIRLEQNTVRASGLFALGDPDYDAVADSRFTQLALPGEEATKVAYCSTRNIRSGAASLKESTVSALPGTRREVELIASLWMEHGDEPIMVCLGPEASEENLKARAPGNRVIHLATHGYFLQGPSLPDIAEFGNEGEMSIVGENPLLLSGLFLAGANSHGERVDSLGIEDGILTAYEVSAMDFAGADLVVLSACETGLGKVEEGEGVYGLRRSFQVAGARTVVSALWPVSDEATADMMSRLYQRQNESIPETMRRIQLDKINELRQSDEPDHPYTWAGFIAMGDWR